MRIRLSHCLALTPTLRANISRLDLEEETNTETLLLVQLAFLYKSINRPACLGIALTVAVGACPSQAVKKCRIDTVTGLSDQGKSSVEFPLPR